MKTTLDRLGVLFVLLLFIALIFLSCSDSRKETREVGEMSCKAFGDLCHHLLLRLNSDNHEGIDTVLYLSIKASNTISANSLENESGIFTKLEGSLFEKMTMPVIQVLGGELSIGMGFYLRKWNLMWGGPIGGSPNSYWKVSDCSPAKP